MSAKTSELVQESGKDDAKKVTLYVVKATPTSGANVVKVMILLDLLQVSWTHEVVVSSSESYQQINPYKMVPGIAIWDNGTNGAESSVTVFDSSACLELIAETFDSDGLYSGRTASERAQVTSWLMAYTAGLGATGKWWLTLKQSHGGSAGAVMHVLVESIKEYAVLESRLSIPNQHFIALSDRLSVADLAFLPFTNAHIAATAGIDFSVYPALTKWSESLMQLPQVTKCFGAVTKFGHE